MRMSHINPYDYIEMLTDFEFEKHYNVDQAYNYESTFTNLCK